MAAFRSNRDINLVAHNLYASWIYESVTNAGVYIDGVTAKDGGLTLIAPLRMGAYGIGNNASVLTFATGGTGAATFGGGLSIAGNVTMVAGSITLAALARVDGRDLSVDGAALDNLVTTIGLAALTSTEVDQLENIGTSAISATEWGYLAEMDQSVKSGSAVSFGAVTATSFVIGENSLSTEWGYLDGVDQVLYKASSPTWGGLTLNGALSMGSGNNITGLGKVTFASSANAYIYGSGDNYLFIRAPGWLYFEIADVMVLTLTATTLTGSLVAATFASLTVAEDGFVGLGASAGRLVFDSTATPDAITLTAADFMFGSSKLTTAGAISLSGGNITCAGAETVDGVDVSAIPSTYLALAGGTITGNLLVDKAADSIVRIDGDDGWARVIFTDGGSDKWESGTRGTTTYALKSTGDNLHFISAAVGGILTLNAVTTIGCSKPLYMGANGLGNDAAVMTFGAGATGAVTVTGNIVMAALKTVDGRDVSVDGATLDAVPTTYAALAGATMAGAIAMGGNSITGLSTTGQVQFDATEYLASSQDGVLDLYAADYIELNAHLYAKGYAVLGAGYGQFLHLEGPDATLKFSMGCQATAMADVSMPDSSFNVWVDEAGDNLTFKVRYSDGTVKSGTVALA